MLDPPPPLPRTLLGVNEAYKKSEKRAGGGGWLLVSVPLVHNMIPKTNRICSLCERGSVYKYMDVSGRTKIPELDMVEPIHPITPIDRLENKNPVHHHPLETRNDQVVDG